MANTWEKAISILAGNLNSGSSYLIAAVRTKSNACPAPVWEGPKGLLDPPPRFFYLNTLKSRSDDSFYPYSKEIQNIFLIPNHLSRRWKSIATARRQCHSFCP